MANSIDPDQFFRSQRIWSYTVCKGMVYLSSAGLGLISAQVSAQNIGLGIPFIRKFLKVQEKKKECSHNA